MTQTNGYDRLLAEAGHGRMTRRDVLKRALFLGLSAPAISALLAACGGGSDTPEPTAASGSDATATSAPGTTATTSDATQAPAADRPVLRYAMNAADLGSLDPHFASSTNDRTAVDMIHNALIRYRPGDSSTFEPDLATEIPQPEMVDGKQVWTFPLRTGVMWHPSPQTESYELTADDIVFSLQKAANPDTSGYSGDYTGMTVEKVDDYTVQITMDTPLSPILFLPKVANYSGGYIMSKQAYDALGADGIKTQPVGTGPFKFKSYTPQNTIELEAWDDYFRGAPKLGGVTLRFMPDVTSRELALRAGDVDVIAGLSEAQWVEKINNENGLKADVFGVGEVTFLNFNMNVEELKDLRVRQALAHAISRDEHLALFGAPVAENVYSFAPAQLMPGGLTEADAEQAGVDYPFDLDRAKQLLTEAGYPDGFSLELITSEMESYRKNYESLQAELTKLGLDIQLKVVDHPTFHSLIREDANPIVIYIAFRPNADVYLTQFFHSDSIVVTGAKPNVNFSHYDQIDDLIESARAETDPDKQAELWKQAQTKVLEDLAGYPLHFINQVYARSEKVDYGHELKSVLALYPGIDETTTIAQ